MHPDVLRAVAATRVQEMIAAAERSDQVRQARRSRRQPRLALPRPLRRAGRQARPEPAGRLVPVGSAVAGEPADGCGQPDRHAA